MDIIISLITFLISAFAFTYGALKLFKKGKPLYFQLIVCAAGCFALEQLSILVMYYCGGFTQNVYIGMFGLFGCNFFLLSANYGTLDKLVDDGSEKNKKAKKNALVAPIITIILIVVVFLLWIKFDVFCAIMILIIILPALPASYFNFKHLIMPIDELGLLKATRKCNAFALAFYLLIFVHATLLCYDLINYYFITFLLMALIILGLVITAVKGAKEWII